MSSEDKVIEIDFDIVERIEEMNQSIKNIEEKLSGIIKTKARIGKSENACTTNPMAKLPKVLVRCLS